VAAAAPADAATPSASGGAAPLEAALTSGEGPGPGSPATDVATRAGGLAPAPGTPADPDAGAEAGEADGRAAETVVGDAATRVCAATAAVGFWAALAVEAVGAGVAADCPEGAAVVGVGVPESAGADVQPVRIRMKSTVMESNVIRGT